MQTQIRLIMLVLASLPSLAMAVAKDAAAPVEQTLWQPYRITPRIGAQHIGLEGEWQLGWRDVAIHDLADLKATTNWVVAQVPSSVQWALYRAGKLPHPYEHLNSQQYDWVDQKVWYYQHSFRLPAVKNDDKVFLCFDGIDYLTENCWAGMRGCLAGR
jgi:beta-mannosidase